jgi:hypothetical protein
MTRQPQKCRVLHCHDETLDPSGLCWTHKEKYRTAVIQNYNRRLDATATYINPVSAREIRTASDEADNPQPVNPCEQGAAAKQKPADQKT